MQVARHQVRKALGIKGAIVAAAAPGCAATTAEEGQTFDVKKGAHHTNRFFQKVDLSNASAFAVISMVGFSRLFLSCMSKGDNDNGVCCMLQLYCPYPVMLLSLNHFLV